MENPGRVAGIALSTTGIGLLIGGIYAYIHRIQESSNSFWSGTTYYWTYPYREMGGWLLAMGFIALILGIIIYVTQLSYQKQVIIEKVKVKCPYCGAFREPWEQKCPGCGAR